jgi:hypothetical protein
MGKADGESSFADDSAAIAVRIPQQASTTDDADGSWDAELIRLCYRLVELIPYKGDAAFSVSEFLAGGSTRTPGADGPDAALLLLCAAFHERHAAVNTADDEDALYVELDRRTAISQQIMNVPATTLAGYRAKAGAALALMIENGHDESDCSAEIKFAMAMLRDLAGDCPIVARSVRLMEV